MKMYEQYEIIEVLRVYGCETLKKEPNWVRVIDCIYMASWLSQSQYDMLTDLATTDQDMGELTKNIIHIHLDKFIHIDDIEDMYEDEIIEE